MEELTGVYHRPDLTHPVMDTDPKDAWDYIFFPHPTDDTPNEIVHTQTAVSGVHVPAIHGHMGGSPFGDLFSHEELVKMGKIAKGFDWMADPAQGECPGEHLLKMSDLVCARRNFLDLPRDYDLCSRGQTHCKEKDAGSKCCYNGCGDVCMKSDELIHDFCYEAEGTMRYQPGEEFMHGEWWCKCDMRAKTYAEMCARLECFIDNPEEPNDRDYDEYIGDEEDIVLESSEENEGSDEDSEASKEETTELIQNSEKSTEEPEVEPIKKKPPKGKGKHKNNNKPIAKKKNQCKPGTKNCNTVVKTGGGKNGWKNPKSGKRCKKGQKCNGKNKKSHTIGHGKSKLPRKPGKNSKNWKKKIGNGVKKGVGWKRRQSWLKGKKILKRRRIVGWRKKKWIGKNFSKQRKNWLRTSTGMEITKGWWNVRWVKGRGSCQNLWVMGCSGTSLNEMMALNLMMAIRQSGYEWSENFIKSLFLDEEMVGSMLENAYLDGYYYGHDKDALNWYIWIDGLHKACNTSIGRGYIPRTWASSLAEWEQETQNVFNEKDASLKFASNWSSLWFDPLVDTCKRQIWIHSLVKSERIDLVKLYEYKLKWVSSHKIENCWTNMYLHWLGKLVPMYVKYTWAITLVGSEDGWFGFSPQRVMGKNWLYGASRYNYVLRGCYNIWSYGCIGSQLNETFAEELMNRSIHNGFKWNGGFKIDITDENFLATFGVDKNKTIFAYLNDDDLINWALWYHAYASVCKYTNGTGSETLLTEAIYEWTDKVTVLLNISADSDIYPREEWSIVWRYPFRLNCIRDLKYYRRFAHDLTGEKWHQSSLAYIMKWLKFSRWQYLLGWQTYFDWTGYFGSIAGYGYCIDRWLVGCNSTLTDVSYIGEWQDLFSRAKFEWPLNFTDRIWNLDVQYLVDDYLPHKDPGTITDDDINLVFWFDGWIAVCNGTNNDSIGWDIWTTAIKEWAFDWADRIDNDTTKAVDWVNLWLEPMLYLCNYTSFDNDTVEADLAFLLDEEYVGPKIQISHRSSWTISKMQQIAHSIQEKMIIKEEGSSYSSGYSYNEGLCLHVWTSVCDGHILNTTSALGIMDCLKHNLPELSFLNISADKFSAFIDSINTGNTDHRSAELLSNVMGRSLNTMHELVWQLWLNAWSDMCAEPNSQHFTMDEMMASLERNYQSSTILKMAGSEEEWKRAWVQPWVQSCLGETFQCEMEYSYEYEYMDSAPMTWNYECMIYINSTMQYFNWTSNGNDWKDECNFDPEAEFDWSNVDSIFAVWRDLCGIGANQDVPSEVWKESLSNACDKIETYMAVETGGEI